MTHAAVCDSKTFHGAYGFWLTATQQSAIRRGLQQVVGRLVLDDSGSLSSISPASFTGLVFSNDVRGKYEAHADCSVTWSLQDDSGHFQHFSGTIRADGRWATSRQTNPGGAEDGTLPWTMDACSDFSLPGKFDLTAFGRTVDGDTAADSGEVSFEDLLMADGAGHPSR